MAALAHWVLVSAVIGFANGVAVQTALSKVRDLLALVKHSGMLGLNPQPLALIQRSDFARRLHT